jgi:hypothetical protein
VSGWSFVEGTSTWITAVSVVWSEPTSVAFAVEPSWNVTVIELAPAVTCSAVMMSPFESISKPVPSATCFCEPPEGPNGKLLDEPALVVESTVMSTTPGASSL